MKHLLSRLHRTTHARPAALQSIRPDISAETQQTGRDTEHIRPQQWPWTALYSSLPDSWSHFKERGHNRYSMVHHKGESVMTGWQNLLDSLVWAFSNVGAVGERLWRHMVWHWIICERDTQGRRNRSLWKASQDHAGLQPTSTAELQHTGLLWVECVHYPTKHFAVIAFLKVLLV